MMDLVELTKMALMEAGRPDLADVCQPLDGRDHRFPAFPRFLLFSQDEPLISKAALLAHQAAGHDAHEFTQDFGVCCHTCGRRALCDE